jgi:hypothetical protein
MIPIASHIGMNPICCGIAMVGITSGEDEVGTEVIGEVLTGLAVGIFVMLPAIIADIGILRNVTANKQIRK